MRIYIAAPLAAHAVVGLLAADLTRRGHIVVSGWHALVSEGATDPHGDHERADILRNNLADLAKAQGLIALTHFDDVVGRGTYGEIAWALSRGLPVAWVHDGQIGRSIFDAHHLVQRFQFRVLWNGATDSAPRVLSDWARLHDAPAEDGGAKAIARLSLDVPKLARDLRAKVASVFTPAPAVVVHAPVLPPDATKGEG